jgi:glycosyltransferase involved in cell wall biosynthesis
MKISYLITCCNETTSLKNLLNRVFTSIDSDNVYDDELIVLQDTNVNKETEMVLDKFRTPYTYYECPWLQFYSHALNNDYGGHKNFGIEKCTGDFIFQLDGDELPPETLLGENLHALLENNPSIEAYAVPRINDFIGVTDAHAKQWGWKLTPSTSIIHEKIIDTNSSEYRFLKENGYILEESEIQ